MLQVEAPAFLQKVGSLLVGVGQNQGAWGSDNLVNSYFFFCSVQQYRQPGETDPYNFLLLSSEGSELNL